MRTKQLQLNLFFFKIKNRCLILAFLIFPRLAYAELLSDFAYRPPVPTIYQSEIVGETDPNLNKNFTTFINFGFPVPAAIGIQYDLSPYFSTYLEAGYSPIPFLLNGAYRSGHIETWGKWHPFIDAFFIGAIFGIQSMEFHTNLSLGSLAPTPEPISSTIYLNSLYLGFVLGGNWNLGQHLRLGCAMGVQIPFFARGGVIVDNQSAAGQNLQAASIDAFSYFAYYVIPRFDFLKVGWEF